MKIIKETDRKVVSIKGYEGTCRACGSPVEYEGELIAVEIYNREDEALLVPVDVLYCPHCSKTIEKIIHYKNLDVTEELKKEVEKR